MFKNLYGMSPVQMIYFFFFFFLVGGINSAVKE